MARVLGLGTFGTVIQFGDVQTIDAGSLATMPLGFFHNPPRYKAPTARKATGPCQVWSWDITDLRSPIPGSFYYLYLIRWNMWRYPKWKLLALLAFVAISLGGVYLDSYDGYATLLGGQVVEEASQPVLFEVQFWVKSSAIVGIGVLFLVGILKSEAESDTLSSGRMEK